MESVCGKSHTISGYKFNPLISCSPPAPAPAPPGVPTSSVLQTQVLRTKAEGLCPKLATSRCHCCWHVQQHWQPVLVVHAHSGNYICLPPLLITHLTQWESNRFEGHCHKQTPTWTSLTWDQNCSTLVPTVHYSCPTPHETGTGYPPPSCTE